MRLCHKYLDGRFFNKDENLITLTTNIIEENYPLALLICEQDLINFLNKNKYAIFWTLLGEKQLIEGSLSRIMQRLTLAHTWYFNKKYGYVGHAWQGRFKSSLIDKENYFWRCGLYIELNAFRAKLVQKPEDWPYSSYNFYAFGKENSLVNEILDIDPYYLELGKNPQERQDKYRNLAKEVMREEFLKNIRGRLDEGVFSGSDFVQDIKEKFKISFFRKRGRPGKEEK